VNDLRPDRRWVAALTSKRKYLDVDNLYQHDGADVKHWSWHSGCGVWSAATESLEVRRMGFWLWAAQIAGLAIGLYQLWRC
jgi:hypothetical protein